MIMHGKKTRQLIFCYPGVGERFDLQEQKDSRRSFYSFNYFVISSRVLTQSTSIFGRDNRYRFTETPADSAT